MRQDDVPDFVPKFLECSKLPDFVSDLALKFPDLVPKLLTLSRSGVWLSMSALPG